MGIELLRLLLISRRSVDAKFHSWEELSFKNPDDASGDSSIVRQVTLLKNLFGPCQRSEPISALMKNDKHIKVNE